MSIFQILMEKFGRKSGSNTNNAEAAHALVNREGKQLSLLSAIIRLDLFFFNCKLRLILLIISNNKFLKGERDMMNAAIKQLKFITKQEYHILIKIRVK